MADSSVALDVNVIETFNKCKCSIMCGELCLGSGDDGEMRKPAIVPVRREESQVEKENQQCENMCCFKKVMPTCTHKTPLACVFNEKKTANVPSRTSNKETDKIDNNLPSSDNSLLLCPSLTDSSYNYLSRDNFPRPKNDFPMNDADSELLEDGNEGTSIYGESENDGEFEASSCRLQEKPEIKASTQMPASSHPLMDSANVESEDVSMEVTEPALRCSLFPHVSPTINFCVPGVKAEKLPDEVSSLLKWKLTVITPIVVKRVVSNSNFKFTKVSNRWVGIWSKHNKSVNFNSLKYYQKMNHFPGTSQIGRKDRLWLNLSRLRNCHGRIEFDFFPKTYLLPKDTDALKLAWNAEGPNQKWIVKPPASARGCGIKVICNIDDLPAKRPLIVQKYLSRPYLIDGSKFDLRIYVYVSSFDPLRIYLYPEGLVRFASVKYTHDLDSLSNNFIHLTNFSINRLNEDYVSNTGENAGDGHKWSLSALWEYLRQKGIDTDAIWSKIEDIVVKAVISCESTVNFLTKASVGSRYNCHELFGFDVMLDENLKPWLIEVNISPSLHSSSPLDVAVKSPLVRDVYNIGGYHIPDKLDPQIAEELRKKYDPGDGSLSSVCIDRLYYRVRSANEEEKAARFAVQTRDEYLTGILDTLTPSDVRHLVESEDELARKGNFLRVFPTAHTHKYLRYFEAPRYASHLLDAWEHRYSHCRDRGIARLRELCSAQMHLVGLKKVASGNKVSRPVPNLPSTKLNKAKKCSIVGCNKVRTTLTTCNSHSSPAFKTNTPRIMSPPSPPEPQKSARKRPPESPLTNSESLESLEVEY